VQWQEPETKSAWKGLWGKPDENAIYLGMWALHLKGSSGNDVNKLIAINYRGIFAGTFINTFYKRGYSFGVQRVYYSKKFQNYFQFDGGYRLGLLWGYKGTSLLGSLDKLIPNIRNIEPLPYIQLIANISWEMVGIQFSYCFVIVSVGFFVKI